MAVTTFHSVGKTFGLKKDLSHLEIFLQSFDFTKPYPWQAAVGVERGAFVP